MAKLELLFFFNFSLIKTPCILVGESYCGGPCLCFKWNKLRQNSTKSDTGVTSDYTIRIVHTVSIRSPPKCSVHLLTAYVCVYHNLFVKMSYHPRTIVPPPRRSASSAVAQALRNASRPRSAGSIYSNPYASTSSSYLANYSPAAYKPNTSSSFLSPANFKSSYARSAAARLSPSRFSGMGSRSGSSNSLSALSTKSGDSEGYIVRCYVF